MFENMHEESSVLPLVFWQLLGLFSDLRSIFYNKVVLNVTSEGRRDVSMGTLGREAFSDVTRVHFGHAHVAIPNQSGHVSSRSILTVTGDQVSGDGVSSLCARVYCCGIVTA